MYLLYSGLFLVSLLICLPYLALRSFREPGYARSLRERLLPPVDLLRPASRPTIWIHAVSVGEVMTAGILLPRLREAFPGYRLWISVTTVTGRDVAEKRLRDLGAERVFYCPLDLGFLVRRVASALRPRALVVMETEIWPHLIRECRRAGAVTLLANARISDDSYPRYRRVRFFLSRVVDDFDVLCAQNETYARRLESLGAPRDRIRVTGSVKFDRVPAEARKGGDDDARSVLPSGRRIWIGGSTTAPEEGILLSVFGRLRESIPSLFLVLAPRHAPRFDEVFALARERDPSAVRRSSLDRPPDGANVLVLDTLGELAGLYERAELVFIGGSLAPRGGHNVIEPGSSGRPVVFGPSMENFADIAKAFVEAGAAVQVENETELESVVRDLLENEARRRAMGESARRLVERERGASKRTVTALREVLRERSES